MKYELLNIPNEFMTNLLRGKYLSGHFSCLNIEEWAEVHDKYAWGLLSSACFLYLFHCPTYLFVLTTAYIVIVKNKCGLQSLSHKVLC